MTINYKTTTAGSPGAGGFIRVNVTLPSADCGDMYLWPVFHKYPTPVAAPDGWFALLDGAASGGHGSPGADAGDAQVTVFARLVTGVTEGGTTAMYEVDVPPGNVAFGQIFVYSKAADKVWAYACASGVEDTPSMTWTATMGVDPGIEGGDRVVVFSAVNTDGTTRSGGSVSIPSVTVGTETELLDGGISNGDDLGWYVSDHVISSGTSSGAATYTASNNTTIGSDAPAGPSVLVRLRELSPTQIEFGNQQGGVSGASSSLAVEFPDDCSAGDLILFPVLFKYPTVSISGTPSGFTAPSNNSFSGGHGSAGTDSGNIVLTLFVRESDGTESGNSATVNFSGAPNVATGCMIRMMKDAGMDWDYACDGGVDNTVGTSWSVTAGADPGIQAGDMVIAISGVNSDIATWSAEDLVCTGVTFEPGLPQGVEFREGKFGTGNDQGWFMSMHRAVSGSSSAAPVYTATASVQSTHTPTGATILIRLRQV